jgi:hypothetical protein
VRSEVLAAVITKNTVSWEILIDVSEKLAPFIIRVEE